MNHQLDVPLLDHVLRHDVGCSNDHLIHVLCSDTDTGDRSEGVRVSGRKVEVVGTSMESMQVYRAGKGVHNIHTPPKAHPRIHTHTHTHTLHDNTLNVLSCRFRMG